MKKLALIILVLFLGFTKKLTASYILTDLPKLIEESKLIVYGKIITVNEASFKIAVLKK